MGYHLRQCGALSSERSPVSHLNNGLRYMIRFSFLALFLTISLAAQSATIVPSPPQLAAKAYILVDANSGAVLVENNADLPLPPASLTKLMTS
jgi:D-alanyl-D-alanine carboxypeptidase (penicillin-binding protein 5/6)